MPRNYMIKELINIHEEILKKFLFEAIFQPDLSNLIPYYVIEEPDLSKYIDQFGKQVGDYAFGAFDTEKEIVGLVWVRLVKGYGHIDKETPELNISVMEGHRGKQLGQALIHQMLSKLATKGYKQVSLSVQKANRALSLYQAIGFEVYSEDEETFTMRYIF